MAPQVVVITGCSEGGIGHALCIAFAKAGCEVFATARRLEAMVGLRELGIETLRLDVTSSTSIADTISAILKKSCGCDQRSGKIVNIGSVVGYVATPFAGTYCASKAAVHSFTDTLRLELKPFGVDVVLIAPGSIRSNIGENNQQAIQARAWSLYSAYNEVIALRANASQSGKSTPTDVFAKEVVQKVLQEHPPRHFTLGHISTTFYILRWLPLWLVDRIFSKKFQLDTPVEKVLQKKQVAGGVKSAIF
eukprot:jgi/Mesen1/2082/ME000151S01341